MQHPGPALGIGGGCDGLGPLPVGGPKKKFMTGVVYRNIWFLGGVHSKV